MDLKQQEGVQSPSSSTTDGAMKLTSEDKKEDDKKKRANSSSVSRPLPKEIWNVAQMSVDRDSETYNMNHKRRGKALIFNHKHFESYLNSSPRDGTEVDVESLESTLTYFGFEVYVYDDLRFRDINEKIQETASEDHSDADCIMVILLTHGNKGLVFAQDAGYEPDILWETFTSDKCPTLAGKPKIFLIQACRGGNPESGTELIKSSENISFDASVIPKSLEIMTYTIPTHADFLVAYSTLFGFLSLRHIKNGTWFIQSFCDVMNQFGATDDFLYNMTRVSRKVAIKIAEVEIEYPKGTSVWVKQIPTIVTRLTRSIIFTLKNDLDHEVTTSLQKIAAKNVPLK